MFLWALQHSPKVGRLIVLERVGKGIINLRDTILDISNKILLKAISPVSLGLGSTRKI